MLDYISNESCIDHMKSIGEGVIDLVVTSPPYAEQRKDTYGGISEEIYPQWFTYIGQSVYKVLKDCGVFVLNIKENVNDGRRSTYVMETVLKLSKIFNWNDTFIWNKTNPFPTGSKKRLKDGFEYCYVFTKSNNYTFNPNNVLVPSTSKYLESEKRRKNKGKHEVTNGSTMNMSRRVASDMVRPSNVITFPIDSTNHKHPATFPIALPDFFIKLYTNEGDVVYDPFMGSGTTALSAKLLGRHYIGSEINEEYVKIANERLNKNLQ